MTRRDVPKEMFRDPSTAKPPASDQFTLRRQSLGLDDRNGHGVHHKQGASGYTPIHRGGTVPLGRLVELIG